MRGWTPEQVTTFVSNVGVTGVLCLVGLLVGLRLVAKMLTAWQQSNDRFLEGLAQSQQQIRRGGAQQRKQLTRIEGTVNEIKTRGVPCQRPDEGTAAAT